MVEERGGIRDKQRCGPLNHMETQSIEYFLRTTFSFNPWLINGCMKEMVLFNCILQIRKLPSDLSKATEYVVDLRYESVFYVLKGSPPQCMGPTRISGPEQIILGPPLPCFYKTKSV